METYDVVAVGISEGKVLWVDAGHSYQNAEAIVRMAIARQGVEDRFFAETISGKYKVGDKYDGRGFDKEPDNGMSEDGRYQTIGGTMYPVGKRGL